MSKEVVDWTMVNNLVKPEHQYREVKNPPLDPVRMAWPFKTKEELEILRKWFKKHERTEKKRKIEKHIQKYGKAFL